MRKIIIDTDTGSDDAVALLMALKSPEVDVVAITTVAGNVPLDLATQNALMTIEVADAQAPPVYMGEAKPLKRELITARNVHGEDGMGDQGLIYPTRKPETGHAVDAILDIVAQNPGEIEIVTIGPATNIARAVMKDAETMRKVKRIFSMGTSGFGPGNTTPVAEFNVYVDAESYEVMLGAGIPVTIVGFDLCLGDAALNEAELDTLLKSGKRAAEFAVQCNATLYEFNKAAAGAPFIDLPDPLAMAVCLWSDVVTDKTDAYCYVCTKEEPAYGQVIIYDNERLVLSHNLDMQPNATVCRGIDSALFKRRMIDLLLA